jgi:hypothetical protein
MLRTVGSHLRLLLHTGHGESLSFQHIAQGLQNRGFKLAALACHAIERLDDADGILQSSSQSCHILRSVHGCSSCFSVEVRENRLHGSPFC